MKLDKLFSMQKELDAHIIREKGLEGQDLLPNLTLGLYTEVGELANEWRGFKHWSNDREPRIRISTCSHCIPRGMDSCCGCEGKLYKNPLLEEYVDCLHFILSIGLQLGFEYDYKPSLAPIVEPLKMFLKVYNAISRLSTENSRWAKHYWYCDLFDIFLGLGKSLGFTWEQIKEAYLNKNQENHRRQEVGY